jgi:CopG family nickel-responsive transcriptional regulator
MSHLTRFGISLDDSLLHHFDEMIQSQGYTSRSEAIRDLIRDALVKQAWGDDQFVVVGTITLIYDHHIRGLTEKLISIQHHSSASVVATLHVHLDHHHCLEVLAVRGKGREIKILADELISLRGVQHGQLASTSIVND